MLNDQVRVRNVSVCLVMFIGAVENRKALGESETIIKIINAELFESYSMQLKSLSNWLTTSCPS